MIGDSQLNIYIVGAKLTPRQRQRLQAQIQTALRSLPDWCFAFLRQRLQEMGASHFPLAVEPQAADHANPRALSLGHIEGRPAAYLFPRLDGDSIDWRQDLRYLVAKAVAYLATPPPEHDPSFWQRWADAVQEDDLRGKAAALSEGRMETSDADLLYEMLAALALSPDHRRWSELPAARGFLQEWQATVSTKDAPVDGE